MRKVVAYKEDMSVDRSFDLEETGNCQDLARLLLKKEEVFLVQVYNNGEVVFRAEKVERGKCGKKF